MENQDKALMENILLLQKGVCDLYLHGTIESSTANVQSTFNSALNDALDMQGGIYGQMEKKGWYPVEAAEQQKITKVKNKFSGK